MSSEPKYRKGFEVATGFRSPMQMRKIEKEKMALENQLDAVLQVLDDMPMNKSEKVRKVMIRFERGNKRGRAPAKFSSL